MLSVALVSTLYPSQALLESVMDEKYLLVSNFHQKNLDISNV
jgi:hypothetical protein